jgi:hypothetical protein
MRFDDVDNISIENHCWIEWNERFLSFRWNSMSEHLHFTIAYNEKSPDINLHLSKNIPNDGKLRYDIAAIPKAVLLNLQEQIAGLFLNELFELVDLNFLRRKYGRRFSWLPFTILDTEENRTYFERRWGDAFKEGYKIVNKTRLKIRGPLEGKIKSVVACNRMRRLIDRNFRSVPAFHQDEGEVGLFCTGKKQFIGLCVDGEWYQFKDDVSPRYLLQVLLGSDLTDLLEAKVKRALIYLSDSENPMDALETRQAIRLGDAI